MFLTESETEQLRESLETMSGVDPELVDKCSHLIWIEAYDEAVRSACTLLEDRLRKAAPKAGLTGTQLAEYAFGSPDSPLSSSLGSNPAEKEGLRQLYSGAFKLFRNPIAHGTVSYGAAESKAIIGFINLLLLLLSKAGKTTPTSEFSPNLERVLDNVAKTIDASAANRLRAFIVRCQQAGLRSVDSATLWIPFITTALIKFDQWDAPRLHSMRLFYLNAEKNAEYLTIPVNQYYKNALGIDVDALVKEYKRVGFQISGKNGDLKALLKTNNSAEYFDNLFNLLILIKRQLDGEIERAK